MSKKAKSEYIKESIAETASLSIEIAELKSSIKWLDPEEEPPIDVAHINTSGPERAVALKTKHFLNKSDTIETKRFKRLIDRLKDDCQGFTRNLLIAQCVDYGEVWMKKESYDYVMGLNIKDLLLAKASSLIFTNFSDHISNTRFHYYINNFSRSKSRKLSYGISFFGNLATITEFTVEQNRHLWEMLIERPGEYIDGINITGYELCEYELESAIRDHISSISLYDETIKESNYTTKIGLNTIEIQEILQYTIYRIIGHIYGLHAEIGDGENLETLSGLNKKVSEVESLMEEQNTLIQQLRNEILSLQKNLDKKKSTVNRMNNEKKIIQDAHSKELNNLHKEILRIQHEYDDHIAKNAEPTISIGEQEEKKIMPEPINNNIDTAEEASKCDINLKYLFVVGDRINKNLINRIDGEFPNAKIVDSTRNINAIDIDLVVLLTEYLPHRLTYAYKGQCTSKNIPYIYCSKTNIDHIKADIVAKTQ